uniref:Uncharacterized protein n=1 Tax=Tanacetum cinerariifolium TaxID=118510 RepID=A0A6L2M2V7_TANCI|nr:hypothetical protein [Tanacetum cinerariifolium]
MRGEKVVPAAAVGDIDGLVMPAVVVMEVVTVAAMATVVVAKRGEGGSVVLVMAVAVLAAAAAMVAAGRRGGGSGGLGGGGGGTVVKWGARGRDTEIPQSSGPHKKVGDEAVYTGKDDKVVRATITATSLEAEQESGSGPRCQDTALGDADAHTSMEHQDDLMDFVPPTPHDSPLSGGHTPRSDKGRPNITEFMDICTQFSNMVLTWEQSKTAQALVIKKLQKKVKRLEKKQRSRTPRMNLFKIGTSRRQSLDKENVSKHGRNLKTRPMFEEGDTINVAGEVNTATTRVSAASASVTTTDVSISTAEPRTPLTTITTVFKDEDLTIAQTLVKMRSEKAKEKGVAFRDVEESARPTKIIQLDEELAKRMHEEEIAEFEKRQSEIVATEDASRAVIKAAINQELDDIQAMTEADEQMASRLQYEEQEQFTIKEKSRMLVKMIAERKRSYDDIQKLFDKAYKQVNSFVPMDLEVVKDSGKKDDSSGKQSGSRKKKQDEQEKEELRLCLKIVQDEDKAINYETLAVKSPIVDWETQLLGSDLQREDLSYSKITRVDGCFRFYEVFSTMLEEFDRQNLFDLHRLVMKRFESVAQEGYDLILWGDLKTMIEPNKEDELGIPAKTSIRGSSSSSSRSKLTGISEFACHRIYHWYWIHSCLGCNYSVRLNDNYHDLSLGRDYDHGSFVAFLSYKAKHRLEIHFHVERKLGFLRGVGQKEPGKESANESDSEEFVNVFVRIGFGSTIKLVSFNKSQMVTFNSKFICGFSNSDCEIESQSDNTVSSPHGQFSDFVRDCFFDRMELFYFVDEDFNSEYVQVQIGSATHTKDCAMYLLSNAILTVFDVKTSATHKWNFFNGVNTTDMRISMIDWKKILASKKKGGLGVSSFLLLPCAPVQMDMAIHFSWFFLWSRFIKAIYGDHGALDNPRMVSICSPWLNIIFDLPLKRLYPRLYALKNDIHVSVAAKLKDSTLKSSFRRSPRGGVEKEQFRLLAASNDFIIMPELLKSHPKKTYKEDLECEMVMVKIPRCMSWLDSIDAYDEPIGLDTFNHDIPLSSREVPSFDEPEPQLLPNFPSLDLGLGGKRGPKPPIRPHTPDSFRMKVVDSLTIHTQSSLHMTSFHLRICTANITYV